MRLSILLSLFEGIGNIFIEALDIILKSINLRHLDVSRLGLEEKIINIAQAARGSIGLLSIHFSENELTNSQIQKVFVELGVDAPNFVFGRQHKFADENKDGPDW